MLAYDFISYKLISKRRRVGIFFNFCQGGTALQSLEKYRPTSRAFVYSLTSVIDPDVG